MHQHPFPARGPVEPTQAPGPGLGQAAHCVSNSATGPKNNETKGRGGGRRPEFVHTASLAGCNSWALHRPGDLRLGRASERVGRSAEGEGPGVFAAALGTGWALSSLPCMVVQQAHCPRLGRPAPTAGTGTPGAGQFSLRGRCERRVLLQSRSLGCHLLSHSSSGLRYPKCRLLGRCLESRTW